jgi:hypothetical protein
MRRVAIGVIAFCGLVLSGQISNAKVPAPPGSPPLTPSAVCPKAKTTTDDGKVVNSTEVCTIIVVVRNTLENIKDKLCKFDVPFNSVGITLKTETDFTVSGNVTFLIVKLGASNKTSQIQTLEIDLTPKVKCKPIVSASATVEKENFSKTLADEIVAAFSATDVALKASTIDMNPHGLSLNVQFGVTDDVNGTIGSQLAIIPITLSLGGDATANNTQSIVFKFGATSPSPSP